MEKEKQSVVLTGQYCKKIISKQALRSNIKMNYLSNRKMIIRKTLFNKKKMKRTCLQKNTNTHVQTTCEFHPDENLLKERSFDPKDIQHVISFVRMKQRHLALSLSMAALLLFGACDKAEEIKTIAIIIPGADHGFMGESIAHAEVAAERFAESTEYQYRIFTSDIIAEQKEQIDQVIAEKADVVVLWPHNGDDLKTAAQKIVDAEIPLIIYDRLISDFDETAEILGDNVTIGEETGHYFNSYFAVDLAAGDVSILEFKGDHSSVTTQRNSGFRSTASRKFILHSEYYTNWSKTTAREQMADFLNNSNQADVEKVKAIFTHDDEIAAGVLEAIEAYTGSYQHNIKLVSGVSASKELLEKFDYYQDLGIDQLTFSFSPAMIVDAIELGIDILDGKSVSGTYLIPTQMVDNLNYMAYMQGPVYQYRYYYREADPGSNP